MELQNEHIEWAKRQARSIARRWPGVPLQDLEQEALIITWRLMCDYDPARNSSWQGFAFETVRSTLLKRCEQFHRWTDRHKADIPVSREPAVQPVEPVEDGAVYQRAHRLLSVLSRKHARIITEHFFEERSFAEIAQARGVSQQYVSQLYGEAIAAMRAMDRALSWTA